MQRLSILGVHFLLVVLMVTASFIETGWDGLVAAVFVFLFALWPLAINLIAAVFSKTLTSQVILLGVTIAYSAWVVWLYRDTQSSADGQAGLALLITAIAALPVLVPAWIACVVVEVVKRSKKNRSAIQAVLPGKSDMP